LVPPVGPGCDECAGLEQLHLLLAVDDRNRVRLPSVDEESPEIGEVLDVVVLRPDEGVHPELLANASGALLAQADQAILVDLLIHIRASFPTHTSRGSSSALASCHNAVAVMSATALSVLPSSLSTSSCTEW